MGFHAPDLADLDRERFFPGLRWKGGAREYQGNFIAGLEVVSTTDDLTFALAIIDAAEGEFVSVGVFIARDDLSHDDAVVMVAGLLDAFYLEPEHREAFGQFIR
jgi:hypothetical protein